jgi:CBS domain-containing protein
MECADTLLNRANQNNEVVIVVNDQGRVRGIITRSDLRRVNAVPPHFSAYA